jgi:hypothetical protein
MKLLSSLFAALMLLLSAGQVMAADEENPAQQASAEKPKYIPWTWDDIDD